MNSYSWSHVPAFRQNQFRRQMGNLERFVILGAYFCNSAKTSLESRFSTLNGLLISSESL